MPLRASTDGDRLRFVILMTDTWRVKRCIIIIIIMLRQIRWRETADDSMQQGRI